MTSKRGDPRVVGLAVPVSETGHVPLLHRTYRGNESDRTVLGECLNSLGKLHEALDDAGRRGRPACRTLVRDGVSWSEQLELDPDVEGYYSLLSLPLSRIASQLALERAARRGAMKSPGGKLEEVRAARFRIPVGDAELDRILVVVESRVRKAPRREHLSEFAIATVKEGRRKVSLHWHVDAARLLERTRLGRRVLCTDHRAWSTGRIV